MHIKPYETALMHYTYYRWHKNLRTYVPPVLIVLGVFGNIFSFIVLRRNTMLKFSTYVYLMVLSVADLLVICIGLLRLWIDELTGYDGAVHADWLCKIVTATGYTVSDWSVWLILAVTVERYIVVCHPLKANVVCNPRRAFYVTLSLLVVMVLINLHFMWTVHVEQLQFGGVAVRKCIGQPEYRALVDKVWPWVDAGIYSLCPFFAIFTLNIVIIQRIIQARRRNRDLREDCGDREVNRSSHQGSTRVTVMLLTINFTFLFTTFPMTVVNIRIAFITDKANPNLVTWWKLMLTVTELLMYANHCFNFYLYLATGQKFRSQLIWLLCYSRRRSQGQGSSGSEGNQPHGNNHHYEAIRKLDEGRDRLLDTLLSVGRSVTTSLSGRVPLPPG